MPEFNNTIQESPRESSKDADFELDIRATAFEPQAANVIPDTLSFWTLTCGSCASFYC